VVEERGHYLSAGSIRSNDPAVLVELDRESVLLSLSAKPAHEGLVAIVSLLADRGCPSQSNLVLPDMCYQRGQVNKDGLKILLALQGCEVLLVCPLKSGPP